MAVRGREKASKKQPNLATLRAARARRGITLQSDYYYYYYYYCCCCYYY